jgi:HEAT repeat protein
MLSTEDRIKALIEDLRSLDPVVVEAAGQALLEIGPASLPFLIDGLNPSSFYSSTETYFRRNLSKALARFGEPAFELLNHEVMGRMNDIYDYDKPNLIEPFGMFGEIAIVPLIEIMKAEIRNDIVGGIEFNCAWALKEIGEPAYIYLLNLIQDTDKLNRYAAAYALGEFKDEQTLAALLNALKDPDDGLKFFAAIRVGYFESEEVIPALQQALLETTNPDVHWVIKDLLNQRIDINYINDNTEDGI